MKVPALPHLLIATLLLYFPRRYGLSVAVWLKSRMCAQNSSRISTARQLVGQEVAGVHGPDLDLPAAISSGFRPPYGENCARPADSPEVHRYLFLSSGAGNRRFVWSIDLCGRNGQEADFDALPTRIRPKSGPETRFPARRYLPPAPGRPGGPKVGRKP